MGWVPVPMLMRARDGVWVPVDLTTYTTDMHDTWVGMWALDSEDSDTVTAISHLHLLRNKPGLVSHPLRTSRSSCAGA
jgi:hypothetical protein